MRLLIFLLISILILMSTCCAPHLKEIETESYELSSEKDELERLQNIFAYLNTRNISLDKTQPYHIYLIQYRTCLKCKESDLTEIRNATKASKDNNIIIGSTNNFMLDSFKNENTQILYDTLDLLENHNLFLIHTTHVLIQNNKIISYTKL